MIDPQLHELLIVSDPQGARGRGVGLPLGTAVVVAVAVTEVEPKVVMTALQGEFAQLFISSGLGCS